MKLPTKKFEKVFILLKKLNHLKPVPIISERSFPRIFVKVYFVPGKKQKFYAKKIRADEIFILLFDL